MKLVIAVVSHDDANAVIQHLTKGGFSSTKLATTGGFLMAGNVTILTGVEDGKVEAVIDHTGSVSHGGTHGRVQSGAADGGHSRGRDGICSRCGAV